MRPFFARLGFLDGILSPPQDAPHAKIDLRKLAFDAVCPLLSLPHVLGIPDDGMSARGAYLSADSGAGRGLGERYARLGVRGHRKIGVAWQANPANVALTNRSLPTEEIALLASIEGIDLVNLQDGVTGRALASSTTADRRDPNASDTRRVCIGALGYRSRRERRHNGRSLCRRAWPSVICTSTR